LKAPTQDGDVCTLVTVSTGTAASAAADLFAAGDYAIAYPHSKILFHGTRRRSPQVVTKEVAIEMAQTLKETNEGFALELAERAFSRFFFRYIWLKAGFAGLKQELGRGDMSDVECFAEALRRRIGMHASLPDKALDRHRRLNSLEEYVVAHWGGPDRSFKTKADFEAFILRCIISYEKREHRRDLEWGFGEDGLAQMQEDFMVMRDYRVGQHTRSLQSQVMQWGEWCLDPEERKEFDAIEKEKRDQWLTEKTQERIRALWYFFISMCRSLQDGENFLSGEEAYWLGLVDEVAGRPDLPCMRVVVENPPKLPAEDAAGPSSGAEESPTAGAT
jgi:ATP-dependent protease ClpP protease subunit